MSEWFESYGFAEVYENLLMGAYPLDRYDVEEIAIEQVTCIYNLVQDDEYADGSREQVVVALAAANIPERRRSSPDFSGFGDNYIEDSANEVTELLRSGHRVYLHCRAGWQRSAVIAAAVVTLQTGCDVETALRLIRERKPTARPLPHQEVELLEWHASRTSITRPNCNTEGL